MNATRWSVIVSNETDRALRMFLAQRGMKKGDLSHFVEEAVKEKLFDLTVKTVKERNAEYPTDEILSTIEEALE